MPPTRSGSTATRSSSNASSLSSPTKLLYSPSATKVPFLSGATSVADPSTATPSLSIPPATPPLPSSQPSLPGPSSLSTTPVLPSDLDSWDGWSTPPTLSTSTFPSSPNLNNLAVDGFSSPPSPRTPILGSTVGTPRGGSALATLGNPFFPSTTSAGLVASPEGTPTVGGLAGRSVTGDATPWSNSGEQNLTPIGSPRLRSSKSASALNQLSQMDARATASGAGGSGGRKKGGFMSKLLRKGSRGDLRSYGDADTDGEYASIPLPDSTSTLPAKLVSRGDFEPFPTSASSPTFSSAPFRSPAPSTQANSSLGSPLPPSTANSTGSPSKRRKATAALASRMPTSSHTIGLGLGSVSAQTPAQQFGFEPLDDNFGPDGMQGIVDSASLPTLSEPFEGALSKDRGGHYRPREHSAGSTWSDAQAQYLLTNGSGNGLLGPGRTGSTTSFGFNDLRRPSLAASSTSAGSAGGTSGISQSTGVGTAASGSAFGSGTRAWTAPDSWAVKGEQNALDLLDTSDEEDEVEIMHGEEESGGEEELGSERGMGLRGRKPSSVGSAGRPTTSGTGSGLGVNGEKGSGMQKNFMIRIHRQDATFSTLPAPLTATAAELVATLARKFQVNVVSPQRYTLYMREKGVERRMGPHEKPILLQKRRFEQAGYTELDKIEDLGREDNSYLCRLVYKPVQTIRPNTEDLGESVEFIDLSGANIETIPIPLYKQAHHIVSLNLSKNRPFELPTDFVQSCTTLRELVLSHMGLKRIPQAVKECVSLTRLDISNNHIVDLEHIALDELKELASLKCHNNRLWSLPEYFGRFDVLKYLNLSNNRFDSLPIVVCKVTSLLELDVSCNTLSAIPAEIGQLVHLERLLLLANSITGLPSSLRELGRLRELDCRRNCISDFSAIASIARLEVLRLEHNQASVLDTKWAQMRVLNASHNSITRFALTGTGDTLTSLNISHAKLASLAVDMFDDLQSVEHLTFDSNQLRVIPEGVGSLANLISLSVRNNILDELPASIGKLQRLQTLQVSGNNLPSFPPTIWYCSQLTVLNASSNLLEDFPDPPTVGASDANIEAVDSRKLSAVSKAPSASSRITPSLALSLQKLYLGDNRMGDDVFVPISLMTELRTLNLSFNDIYEIPPTSLAKCQQLEELYLSGNKLTNLTPEDLSRLTNLKLLYVNGNKLQTLPSELGSLRKLLAFDVGSNVLKYNINNWPFDWNWYFTSPIHPNYNRELRYLNLSGNKRLEIKPSHQSDGYPRSGNQRIDPATFVSVPHLHILGLMDVTLPSPSLPDESERRRIRTSLSEINDMAYGIADTLGAKAEVLSLTDLVVPRFRAKEDEAIFGLFDAITTTSQETGARLVKYLQDFFIASFTLELSKLRDTEVVGDAFRRSFLGLNRDFGNLILPESEATSFRKGSDISLCDRGGGSMARTGAAGIIVYIQKKRMVIANAGNALAVIAGRGGTARLMAKKHDPFDPAEVARIRTAEGWISTRGAVNDEVDISRSFGFYNVVPAINASPNVEEIELTETDEFVIIANRGLWEFMSYQQAVDLARTERNDPMVAAAKLRDLAISYGSSGNIMVMVVAVGDLFKAKRDYRNHRVQGADGLDSFYGQNRPGLISRRLGRPDEVGDRTMRTLDREVDPPIGQLALVFTDIRNSTALWESNPGMQTAIRMHNQLLRRQLRAIGGYEVKTEGDAFMVSFPTIPSALLWCLTVQLELLREDWPQEILDSEEGKEIANDHGEILYRGLSVRMGIHWGAPLCEADPVTRRMDYFGSVVNRSARISSVAEGGQIAISQEVVDIIDAVVIERKPSTPSIYGDVGEVEEEEEEWLEQSERQDVLALRRLGFGVTTLGERRLKGLEAPEILSLLWPTALKGRNKPVPHLHKHLTTEIQDPSARLMDPELVRNIGRVCQRLETVAGYIAHPERMTDGVRPHHTLQQSVLKRGTLMHPVALSFAGIRSDSTDAELLIALDHFIVRVEHALSTLVLHQLGPIAEVLAALGGALKTDPSYILNALSRYGSLLNTVQ